MPTLDRARPVTWFRLVFEEVELGDRHGRVVLDDAIHAKQVLGPVDAFGDQLKGVHWKGDVPLISMWLCLPGRAEEDADQASRHTDHHATSLPRIPSEQNRARLPANQSYPANPLSDDVVRVYPEMPQLAFQNEFLVGAFAAVTGGSYVRKGFLDGTPGGCPEPATARKSKVADTGFRQILGDRLPDEERGPLGPVAVVGQDIGEVLGLEIDGTKVTSWDLAVEPGESRPLAVDVGGEIDFLDRRCG